MEESLTLSHKEQKEFLIKKGVKEPIFSNFIYNKI